MRNWKTLLASVLVASVGFIPAALAQDEAAAPPITDLPRNENEKLRPCRPATVSSRPCGAGVVLAIQVCA